MRKYRFNTIFDYILEFANIEYEILLKKSNVSTESLDKNSKGIKALTHKKEYPFCQKRTKLHTKNIDQKTKIGENFYLLDSQQVKNTLNSQKWANSQKNNICSLENNKIQQNYDNNVKKGILDCKTNNNRRETKNKITTVKIHPKSIVKTYGKQNEWGFSGFKDFDEKIFHIKILDNRKEFECPLDVCKKRFSDLTQAKRHFLKHTDLKPHICLNSGCERKFSRKDNMKTHAIKSCPFKNKN